MCMWGQWSDTYLEISGYQDPLLTGNRGSSLRQADGVAD